jgi:fucose 4-O-acetylase-like acetyltransferase
MIANLHYSPKSQINNIFDFGIAFLKVFLAFDVVRSHSFNAKSTKNKYLLFFLRNRRFHVPSFFIISFYFMHKEFISFNINRYIKRIERLIIPYLIWPFIIWSFNNILNYLLKTNYSSSLKNLIYQLLWGNNFIKQLWFQWDLIIITILYFIILYSFKSNYLLIIQLLTILAYILQYSGINKKFYNRLRKEQKECLGRLVEVINISSICIIFVFSLFPSEKITITLIKIILKYITNFTAGIFYLHWSIILYLKSNIKIIKNGSFSGIIVVYLICYTISFIGTKIFGKTKLKHLFS